MHRVTATGETTTLADRKRRAGQRLVLGIPGPSIDPVTRELIKTLRPAGFILFKRNVEEPAQVRELNRELASLLPKELPPLLSVDQEGGRVMRVRDGATRWPPLRWLGNCDDLDLTQRYARALSAEVAALGFNLNWAPVADVNSNPKNPVIGDRAFGDDPALVERHVVAWLQAAQAQGMISCVKHFPGHGDTSVDSHHDLPVVEKDPPDLKQCELRPFRAAVAAGVAGVMSSHVVFPTIDEHNPATMSRAIMRDWLRGELGYGGLVVSDDMEMKAIKDRWELPVVLEKACTATIDLFLVCSEQARQVAFYEELIRLQEHDKGQHTLAEDSEKRLKVVRERFFLKASQQPELDVLDSPAFRELALWVRARGEMA